MGDRLNRVGWKDVAMPKSFVCCCIDKTVMGRRAAEAARLAALENIANKIPLAGPELAAIIPKRWRPGRMLRVSLMNASGMPARVRQGVEKYAKEWSKYANIRFSFIADDNPTAEIRVAFEEGAGSWSYIGTDALLQDLAEQPTMNFGWLDDETSEEEISRVVLHEFGHALGCIHEHQNPAAGIPWKREEVYAYYGGAPNYWTRGEVDQNLFRLYDRDITQFSTFDRDSIMLYPIDARFVSEPSFAVGLNNTLSQTDKIFIATVYPGAEAVPAAAAEERPPANLDQRAGYEPGFLGDGYAVGLPELDSELQGELAPLSDGSRGELRYEHFSVMMSRSRRMAIFTAANIDGSAFRDDIGREGTQWFFDPRMAREFHTGNDVYAGNVLDRGHLVRRQDPVWGDTAEVANEDTFSFANACPQHEGFNQKTWLSLEDYVLKGATQGSGKGRISVFTGPVFADDDSTYRGARLPKQFWKMVAWVDGKGQLAASAYMISQEDLLERFLAGQRRRGRREMAYGAFKTYQTTLRLVEELTGLRFTDLGDADVLGGRESIAFREIETENDLVF
jgi:endonuclease G